MSSTISLQTFNNRDSWITFPGKGMANVHTLRFDAMGKAIPGSKGVFKTTEENVNAWMSEALDDSGQPNPITHNAYASALFLRRCGFE